MKVKKLREYLARLSQFLLWTPANVLLSDTGQTNSLALFSRFQRHEQFFLLKIVLVGVVGFAIILGATSFSPQSTEYNFPLEADVIRYYSLAVAVGHVLLVTLALLGERFQRLVILRRPWIFAATSYMVLIPLMSCLVFTRQMLDARLYLTSTSLICIVATVYFQESFLVTLFIWLTILISSIIYFVRNSEVEQVSLPAYTYLPHILLLEK